MKISKKILAAGCLAIISLSGLTSCEKTGFKVGLICLHGQNSSYDNNFIQAFEKACQEEGLTEGANHNGYEIRTDVAEDYNKIYTAAKEWAEDGYSMIFSDSFGHQYGLFDVAKEYPTTVFCHATGTFAVGNPLKNYHTAFADIYQGRYLAGVLAGEKLYKDYVANGCPNETIKIGYVGAMPYAEVISGYTSFYLGVCSVFDKHSLNRPEMVVRYTNSWYDYQAEYEAAKTLILQEGCKLISQHADSYGAPKACEDNNIPNISYNISTKKECKNTYLGGSKINWRPYFIQAIRDAREVYHDGARDGQHGAYLNPDYTAGFSNIDNEKVDLYDEDNSIQLLEFSDEMEEYSDEIIDIATELRDGGKEVFDVNTFTVKNCKRGGFEMDSDGHLTKCLADIDGDYVPEENVIKHKSDGSITFFAESDYDAYAVGEANPLRSAPYFDLIIDGITTLN